MKIFDELLEPVRKDAEQMTFSEIIRQARDTLGIRQYRIAELCGVNTNRLKNLETGYFRNMPDIRIIRTLAAIYEIPEPTLVRKCKEHVEERRLARKVRTIEDGSSAVPSMQNVERRV